MELQELKKELQEEIKGLELGLKNGDFDNKGFVLIFKTEEKESLYGLCHKDVNFISKDLHNISTMPSVELMKIMSFEEAKRMEIKYPYIEDGFEFIFYSEVTSLYLYIKDYLIPSLKKSLEAIINIEEKYRK